MTEKSQEVLEPQLEQYLSSLLGGLGREERCRALCWYASGLLLCGERKSITPMAARLCQDESEVGAVRQRLQQAVVVADWDETVVRKRMSELLHKELGELEAVIGDDTGIARYGDHCVGTARQYSGTLGRVDRCQVIPSLHAAGKSGSFCLGARLYLPESWTSDPVRLQKAGVPPEIRFETKWQMMLGLLDKTRDWGFEDLPFVGDAAYGDVGEFRRALNQRGTKYVVEVAYTTCVWAPGTGPESPEEKRQGTTGRPRKRYRSGEYAPVTVAELVLSQTETALKSVTWRNGQGEPRTSRFGALLVQPASGHPHGLAPEPLQWLFWDWPEGADRP